MKCNLLIFISFLLLFACKEPEARKPKQHSTTNFYKELIEENKKLNEREQRFLKKLISNDTTKTYLISQSGFWYTYLQKDTLKSTIYPKKNDIVTIEFDVTDIKGNVLYPKQQKEYKVDKQDFIPALQDGIKLMKQGETITFVVPSYRAYGVTGDGNKIGINQPIKSTIKLINIKNQYNESE